MPWGEVRREDFILDICATYKEDIVRNISAEVHCMLKNDVRNLQRLYLSTREWSKTNDHKVLVKLHERIGVEAKVQNIQKSTKCLTKYLKELWLKFPLSNFSIKEGGFWWPISIFSTSNALKLVNDACTSSFVPKSKISPWRCERQVQGKEQWTRSTVWL